MVAATAAGGQQLLRRYTWGELGGLATAEGRWLPRENLNAATGYTFDQALVYGTLPAIVTESDDVEGGRLFEHAVILEIIRWIRVARLDWRVHYWRKVGGAEVDCVIDTGERLIPIEIKSGTSVRLGTLKGLANFMDDYGVEQGFVVFRGRLPERLTERIIALPWQFF